MTHVDVAAAPAGRGAGPARRTRSPVPTLRLERSLLRDGYPHVIGMDEVGRGALAGPVSVGAVLVEAATRSAPVGLRDSKLLSPVAREALAPRLRRWARRWAVGHASPTEIDEIGIIAALRLAGRRALCQLDVDPGIVILDGNHDWLSTPAVAVDAAQVALPLGPVVPVPRPDPRVRTLIKADLRCAAVAAASVLAKTTRDAMMVDLARTHPLYRWDLNKGYSAPEHLVALGAHGACPQHRLSWRLPGLGGLHPLQAMIPMADDDGKVWAEADAELDLADAELNLADAELDVAAAEPALMSGGRDESAMAAGPPADGGCG